MSRAWLPQTADRVFQPYVARDANAFYPRIVNDVMEKGLVSYPRGLETREIHPTATQIFEPRKRIITSHGRVLNLPFACAEVLQILLGIDNPRMLRYYNSQIIKIQGDYPQGETEGDTQEHMDNVFSFNAAYGTRLRRYEVAGEPNGLYPNNENISRPVDQLDHVIKSIQKDPDTRQATIVLSHPKYDHYSRRTKDRACNVLAHVMLREGYIDWLEVIRSNDAVWGIPYNIFQWTHVQEWVAAALDVGIGEFTFVQDSFHIYSDKYEEARGIKAFDFYGHLHARGIELLDLAASEGQLRVVVSLEYDIRQGGGTTRPFQLPGMDELVPYWQQFALVFNAFTLFKNQKLPIGPTIEAVADLHPEFKYPLLRYFASIRWAKGFTKELRPYSEKVALEGMVQAMVEEVGVPLEEAWRWFGVVGVPTPTQDLKELLVSASDNDVKE